MNMREPDPLDLDLLNLLKAEQKRSAPAAGAQERVLASILATIGGAGGGGGSGGPPKGGPQPGPSGGEGLSGAQTAVNSAALPTAGGAGGVGGVGGAAAAGAGSSGSAATGLVWSAIGKPIVIFVGAAVVALGVAAGLLSSPGETSTPVTAVAPAPFVVPAPVLTAAAEDLPPSVPAPTEAPAPQNAAPSSRPSAALPSPSAQGHDTSLAAERAILESARAAIAGGQAGAGFDALTRHAREFPRGRLAEEREGLWIRALLAAGRTSEASARFARFKRSYPKSMLLPAFEESLGENSVTEP